MKYENLLVTVGIEYIIGLILIGIITKNLWIVLILGLLLAIFFSTYKMNEDEKKKLSSKRNIFYSPAQGKIQEIKEENDIIRISIFLGITDNHKQYIPIKSKFINKKRIRGAFLPAFSKESEKNDRIENKLQSIDYNFEYNIIQATGVMARRIITLVDFKDTKKILLPGDDLGFIVLGSRVDIEIPKMYVKKIYKQKGDRIKMMEPLIELI